MVHFSHTHKYTHVHTEPLIYAITVAINRVSTENEYVYLLLSIEIGTDDSSQAKLFGSSLLLCVTFTKWKIDWTHNQIRFKKDTSLFRCNPILESLKWEIIIVCVRKLFYLFFLPFANFVNFYFLKNIELINISAFMFFYYLFYFVNIHLISYCYLKFETKVHLYGGNRYACNDIIFCYGVKLTSAFGWKRI